jgi:hypothetical protein
MARAHAAAASAAPEPTPWAVPAIWGSEETAVCLGGGPSLTQRQVDAVRGRARAVAVNDAYRLAPWADVLYACDYRWWEWHPGALGFAGEKVTYSRRAAQRWPGLRWIRGDPKAAGLSTKPRLLHCGRNSGYQGINLAYLYGARRIVLLGYDMQLIGNRAHWFGEHPNKVRSNYKGWLTNYQTIAAQLPSLGLQIINCTPGSALRCFPMGKLEDVLMEAINVDR